jgi:hypothetical protein
MGAVVHFVPTKLLVSIYTVLHDLLVFTVSGHQAGIKDREEAVAFRLIGHRVPLVHVHMMRTSPCWFVKLKTPEMRRLAIKVDLRAQDKCINSKGK